MYRSGLSTIAEVQANRLAAQILMPLFLIEKAIQSGVASIEALANKFAVSKDAMRIRLGVADEIRIRVFVWKRWSIPT